MLRPLFVGVLVLVLILTACGKDAPAATQAPTATPLPTVVPATLAVWYSDPDLTDGLTTLTTAFSKTYPTVNIELTLQDAQTFPEVVRTALQAGQGPDLMIASAPTVRQWLEAHLLTPLESPEMRQLLSFTTPNSFLGGMYNDVMYAYPLALELPLLYLNTDLVKEDVRRFETLVAVAAESGALIQPDFMMTHGWLQMENMILPLRPYGELTSTAQGFTDYFNRLITLRDTANVRFSTDATPFKAGEVGWYVGSSRELNDLKTALGDKLAVGQPMIAPELASYQFATPTLLVMSLNATDASVEAGRLWIEYLAQPDQQMTFSQLAGFFPMRYVLNDDVLLEQVTTLAQTALVVPINGDVFYDTLLPSYNNAIAQVLAGVVTPLKPPKAYFKENNS